MSIGCSKSAPAPGYATAVLAEIGAQVVSIERFQTLAIGARLRLERLGKRDVEIICADGLAVPAVAGPFDRILVHGRLDEVPPRLVALLEAAGRIVLARQDRAVAERQVLVDPGCGRRSCRDGDGTVPFAGVAAGDRRGLVRAAP